ncbi:MAG TPA: porin [Myxococcota bacterium]|jgi:hypothetical protein|nr:porin [Myxococcota bacterium]
MARAFVLCTTVLCACAPALAAAAPADAPPESAPAPAAAGAPAAAPAKAPESAPATAAAATPAPAPAAPPAAAPVFPKKLSVGTSGLFQPGILLQAWFLVDGADAITSTFRLRRAELHVKGEIIPGKLAYAVMIDPAKVLEFKDFTVTVANQDPPPTDPTMPETVTERRPVSAVSALQDFYITWLTPWVDVSVGQFKIPVSWEGYNSSAKLLLPERAPVSREFGDKRDLGVRLAKTFKYFGYSAGVFNGAGLNNLDVDNSKDVGLRLEAYPIEGLMVGAVGYVSVGPLGAGNNANNKDRYEADLRFERWNFLFQGEYIRAHDVAADGTATDAHGFYAAVAYTFFGHLQPVVRLGYFDPDLSADLMPASAAAKDEFWHLDVGVNWYIVKQEARLSAVYSRFEFDDKTPNNELILAGQLSF